jgi:hypothetical protein
MILDEDGTGNTASRIGQRSVSYTTADLDGDVRTMTGKTHFPRWFYGEEVAVDNMCWKFE